MSRYYRIELTDTGGSPIDLFSFGTQATPLPLSPNAALESGVITSLLPNGTTNPAALNIELDIEQLPAHLGDQRSYVRIYGLALADIFRRDLNQQNIAVKVGMAKGLPLAKPGQAGLVMKGAVWQAFGNWLGTDMTLDLVIGAGGLTGTQDDPQPYLFTWTKGQKLSEAITKTIHDNDKLSKLKVDVDGIADDRTANEDKSGYFMTATEFSQMVQGLTKGQRGQKDDGVYIAIDGQSVTAGDTGNLDDTGGGDVIEIGFEDLIGQVTWFAPQELTCKLVMRGDLQLFKRVKFSKGANIITTAAAMPSLVPTRDRDQTGAASGGEFFIKRIHHWGNYRQADAMSWNTTLGLLKLGGV